MALAAGLEMSLSESREYLEEKARLESKVKNIGGVPMKVAESGRPTRRDFKRAIELRDGVTYSARQWRKYLRNNRAFWKQYWELPT
jgi:hypothetical protein